MNTVCNFNKLFNGKAKMRLEPSALKESTHFVEYINSFMTVCAKNRGPFIKIEKSLEPSLICHFSDAVLGRIYFCT